MSVIRVNEFRASAGRHRELHAALAESVRAIRVAPGCLSVKLLVSERDEGHLVVLEDWKDRESHQAAVANISAEALHRVMTLVAEVPSGGYYVERD